MAEKLSMALVELKRDEVLEEVKRRAKANEDPSEILKECQRGMNLVGDRFQTGEYFLAELMLAAEIFNNALAILEPYMAKSRAPTVLGKAVVATLKGDIHDLGKNIFATVLNSQGFEVYDLGVDVAPNVLVEKVKEIRPEFVGFSILMTPTIKIMRETARILEKMGLRQNSKLMIGGGVTTPAVAEYVGADFQTTNAWEGVTYCMKVIGGK